MTGTYISPINCASFGFVTTSVNQGTAFTLVSPENFSCFSSQGLICDIPNVPFGNHTIQVTTNSPTDFATITINDGQSQSGINGTYTFNVVNSTANPFIDIIVTV